MGYKSMKGEKASHSSLNLQAKGSTESCKELTMDTSDALTDSVDQLNAPASAFPTLADSNASSTSEVLKWTYLVQDTVYQVVSTRTVNTQHGQSIILSPQKSDGSCCSAWACGMLTKELLQNPMVMVNSRLLYDQQGRKRA